MEGDKPSDRQRRPVSSTLRQTKLRTINQHDLSSPPFPVRSRPGTGKSRSGETNFQRDLSNEEDQDEDEDSDYYEPLQPDITLSRLRPRSLEDRLANLGINIGLTPEKGRPNKSGDATRKAGMSSRKDSVNVTSSARRNFRFSDSGDSSDLSERKSARLSSEIDRRISGISSSMQEFDRKVRDVNETLNEAYRKSLEDSLRNKKMLKEDETHSGKRSGGDSPDSLEAYLRKSRDNLAKDLLVELGEDFKPIEGSTRAPVPGPGGDNSPAVMMNLVGNLSPRKIFGLDASAILKSSSGDDTSDGDKGKVEEDSSSSDDSEDSGAAAMRISIKQPRTKAQALKRIEENLKNKKGTDAARETRPKLRKKSKVPPEFEREPRSLSPIMPSLPDKQFQSMLERREERVNRHLNSMKNELAQLSHRVEIDRRKADSVAGSGSLSPSSRRRVTDAAYQGKPMRLLKGHPDKVSTEFNEFVQSTGGMAGGWERKDHLAFVKVFDVWRKHPNKLMEMLKKELKEKKTQDIAAHIKWYERFEELSSKNRASVHKWTQEKRKENEMVFQMSSASQRAKLENEKRRQEHLRMIREQERDKSKAKLAQWKRAQSVRTATAGSSTTQQNFSIDSEHSPRERESFPRERPQTSSSPLHQASTFSHQPPQSHKLAKERPKRTKDVPAEVLNEFRDESGNLDIPGVRQHILEITAKVHSLDHPKRDFLPPRPLPRKGKPMCSTQHHHQHSQPSNLWKGNLEDHPREISRTFSQTRVSSPPQPGKLDYDEDGTSSRRGSVRLPEIEPDALSRPGSRPGSRSFPAHRSKLSELRERDNRLIEAKKKAIEIARDRRKANLSQLTAEELRRRIRSRAGPSTFLNPTKQSELRKSLTHLEKLETLSKQDLNLITQGSAGDASRLHLETAGLPKIISNVPAKGIPSWRRSDF